MTTKEELLITLRVEATEFKAILKQNESLLTLGDDLTEGEYLQLGVLLIRLRSLTRSIEHFEKATLEKARIHFEKDINVIVKSSI